MIIRIVTAIVSLPILILPIFLGGISLYTLVMLLSLVGCYELLRATNIKDKGIVIISLSATIVYYVSLWFFGKEVFTYIVALYLLTLLSYFVFRFPSIPFVNVAVTAFGFFYITYFISHIIFVRETKGYGGWFVWLVFIIGFGSDTFAYFAGRFFGKHKLVKELSPKKTVEGFIGGIIGAALLTVAFAVIMGKWDVIPKDSRLWLFAIMGAIGAAFSVIGDLAASAIKRQTGIKDFGKLLPGHGGIIDRFDSNIFTAPFVYYIMMVWLKLQG